MKKIKQKIIKVKGKAKKSMRGVKISASKISVDPNQASVNQEVSITISKYIQMPSSVDLFSAINTLKHSIATISAAPPESVTLGTSVLFTAAALSYFKQKLASKIKDRLKD